MLNKKTSKNIYNGKNNNQISAYKQTKIKPKTQS